MEQKRKNGNCKFILTKTFFYLRGCYMFPRLISLAVFSDHSFITFLYFSLLFTTVHDPSDEVKERLGIDVGLNFVINTEMKILDNKTCPNIAKCVRDKLGSALKGHEQNNSADPMWEV